MQTEDAGGRSSAGLGPLWTQPELDCGWQDLVLPDGQLEALRSIRDEIRHRGAADGQARTNGAGAAIRVLFAGAPGTGRTTAAKVLASELQLNLVRGDLRQIVDTDPDETEASLDSVIAHDPDALILLHEAEAVFGRGLADTRPRDRRAANLLPRLRTRIERHKGPIILAARLKTRIDDDTMHRIEFIVNFPFPEADARERIWKQLLPANARLQATDVAFLASSFKLTGGAIHRCIQAAAVNAGSDSEPLELRHVVSGLEAEYSGRLLSSETAAAIEQARRQAAAARGGVAEGWLAPELREEQPRKAPATPARAEPKPAPRAEPKPAPRAEPKPAPRAEPKPAPRAEPAPAPRAEPKPAPAPPARKEPAPAARAEQKPQPPPPAHKDATPAPRAEPAPVTAARPAAAAEPRRPSAPPPQRATERRIAPLVALGGAVALIAALLGLLAANVGGSSSSSSSHQLLNRHASVGLVRASFPMAWRRLPAQATNLGLSDEFALSPASGAGPSVVIGRAAVSGSALPAAVLSAFASQPTPQVVALGGAQYYRYLNVPVRGLTTRASVYALPSSVGTLVGICDLTHGGPAFAGQCERVVATMRPLSGAVLPLGASRTYAATLNRVLAQLSTARSAADGRLHRARTPGAQARAAGELAAAHLRAAAAIAAVSAGAATRANQALTVALRAIATGYTRLGQAASRGNSSGYGAARAQIRSAGVALTSALRQLTKLGYAVG